MSPAPPSDRIARRQRLIDALQGRWLEDAYRRDDVRRDLEAEAADPDPDRLLGPDQLLLLRELLAERDAMRRAGGSDAAAEWFFSTAQVVVVPGFLASELSDTAPDGRGLVWLSPRVVFSERLSALQLAPYDGSESDLRSEVRVEATGGLPFVYDLLRLDLELRRYTLAIHPIDWRKDGELSATRLVGHLRALVAESSRPIHLIAHSQGAIVARRALRLLHEGGETAVLDRIRHLVLLGPATFGTFSAAFAIAGSHGSVETLRRFAVDPPEGFQPILASMTGLYQLLPWDATRIPWLTDHPLGDATFWQGGPAIDADRLSRFFRWSEGRTDTAFFDDRTAVILGGKNGAPTAGGAAFDGNGALLPSVWLSGDGTVPHSCSVLPGTATYLADEAEHATIATYRSVLGAVRDLLADRAPNLPAVSSDPADYLSTMEAVAFEAVPPRVAREAAIVRPSEALGVADLIRTAAAVAIETNCRVRVEIAVDPPTPSR